MRARADAARIASRPIVILQVLAGVTALAVGMALLVALGTSPLAWAGDFAQWLAWPVAGVAASTPTGPRLAIIMAIGAWLLIVPVAVYVALRD